MARKSALAALVIVGTVAACSPAAFKQQTADFETATKAAQGAFVELSDTNKETFLDYLGWAASNSPEGQTPIRALPAPGAEPDACDALYRTLQAQVWALRLPKPRTDDDASDQTIRDAQAQVTKTINDHLKTNPCRVWVDLGGGSTIARDLFAEGNGAALLKQMVKYAAALVAIAGAESTEGLKEALKGMTQAQAGLLGVFAAESDVSEAETATITASVGLIDTLAGLAVDSARFRVLRDVVSEVDPLIQRAVTRLGTQAETTRLALIATTYARQRLQISYVARNARPMVGLRALGTRYDRAAAARGAIGDDLALRTLEKAEPIKAFGKLGKAHSALKKALQDPESSAGSVFSAIAATLDALAELRGAVDDLNDAKKASSASAE